MVFERVAVSLRYNKPQLEAIRDVIEAKLKITNTTALDKGYVKDKETGLRHFAGWKLKYSDGAARELAAWIWPHAGHKSELLFALNFGDLKYNADYAKNPPAHAGNFTKELVQKCQNMKKAWSNR